MADIKNMKVGLLTVVEVAGSDEHSTLWRCICDCGSIVIKRAGHLMSGGTKSCGCLRKRLMKERNTTHNMSRTKIYGVWRSMLDRCRTPSSQAYYLYGARGITVCKRWHKFENFLADMGARPDGMELDRINNNGPYSPKNCRWTDRTTQIRNRRSTILVTHQGVTKTLSEWAEDLGVPYTTVQQRYYRLGRVHLTPQQQP
jgi:hypothetical protein